MELRDTDALFDCVVCQHSCKKYLYASCGVMDHFDACGKSSMDVEPFRPV